MESDQVNAIDEPLTTVAEVADRWKCSPALVYALVGQGKLQCYRLGLGRGTIRFTEDQLRQYLEHSVSSRAAEEDPWP